MADELEPIPLTGGAYMARSLIANAQRCVNLYPEINPGANQPAAPVTHYQTPGLRRIMQPAVGTVRGMYRASNGGLFMVIGSEVYFVDLVVNYGFYYVGSIPQGTSPVKMSDNGQVVVLVDGTANGWWWKLQLSAFGFTQINDAAFYGANFVAFLDGYLIFNRPGTNQFYISPSFWNGTDPFDGTDIQQKTGGTDQIIGLAVIHREVWLIGQLTTEVWYNAGNLDFPFERLPGVFLNHGMLRGYSLCQADVSLFWLGRDTEGQSVVFQTQEYAVKRISNHAIETMIQQFSNVADVIGFTYQQQGHTFVCFSFPSADKTIVFDLATEQWHERAWLDSDGALHRHRASAVAAAYNFILCGDHETGWLYQWDPATFSDAGDAIPRIRSFPHIVKGGRLVSYDSLAVDMSVAPGSGEETPTLLVRWSDSKGRSWGDTVELSMGDTGADQTNMILRNLGAARDRVFEFRWDTAHDIALQGAWITMTRAET